MDDPVSLPALAALDDDRWRRLAAQSPSTPAPTADPAPPTLPETLAAAADAPLPRYLVERKARPVAPTVVRDAADVAAQQKLDAFRESMTGTYQTVDGKELKVATPFQMDDGYPNQHAYLDPTKSDHLRQRNVAAQRAQLDPEAYGRVVCGRGTPAEIHALTQALLDAQPPGSVATAAQLRQLMFDNCVGVDCAGYVQQAYLSVTGQTRAQAGLGKIVNESLSNLGQRGFARVGAVGDLRPGDIVVLAAPAGDRVGHRTIVYEQRIATASDMRSLLASQHPMQIAFAIGGPLHVIEVDSSWGCGVVVGRHVEGRAERGGVAREAWLYNESTRQWASWSPVDQTFWVSDGPYGHPLDGFFREGGLGARDGAAP